MTGFGTYYADQELPAFPLVWKDRTGAFLDFTSGWTFTIEFVSNGVVVLSKTTGFTGSDGSSGVNLLWQPTAEVFAALAGYYTVRYVARNTASGLDDVCETSVTIKAKPTAAP
jgi:hypothetical protein